MARNRPSSTASCDFPSTVTDVESIMKTLEDGITPFEVYFAYYLQNHIAVFQDYLGSKPSSKDADDFLVGFCLWSRVYLMFQMAFEYGAVIPAGQLLARFVETRMLISDAKELPYIRCVYEYLRPDTEDLWYHKQKNICHSKCCYQWLYETITFNSSKVDGDSTKLCGRMNILVSALVLLLSLVC